MAETKVKIELESEPSVFVNDETCPASLNAQLAYDPLWKRRQDNLLQQVEVEEQSLEIAVPQILELKWWLLKYADTVPSVNKKIESIDAIVSRKKKCRITAGVVGPTGMGKSTLWNAVLGFRELLPTDNSQACTSAIIEVLWNSSDDPSAIFQAKIIFLQVGDWQTEIEQLYRDLEALAGNDTGDGDGMDIELGTRIDAVMERVRAVYPFIDTKQDLKKTSIAKLMKHSNVQNLGKELDFTGTNLKGFSSQIRQYIVSSVGDKKFAPWPLVKIAQIYVKSQILKDGLVLVDIPGSMDTNAARNSLAQTYQRDLSVNCILTASKRATSDQTAQISLNETYQRNLQLDGHWKSDNIIFIVARTDESITVDDHIDKNPVVAKRLTVIFEKERVWNQRKSLAEQEISAIKTVISKSKRDLRNVEKELKKLWSWLNNIPEIESLPNAVKRKASTELLKAVLALNGISDETKANAEKLTKFRDDRANARKHRDNGYRMLSGKQKDLQHAETVLGRIRCVKTRACIDHRSQVQTTKIQEYFERISQETGNASTSKLLPVHCVSASKFLDFIDNKPPSPGFPVPHNTNIPQLRKALVGTTLKTRHRNAKTTLEEIEALVNSIKSWAKSLDTSYQMIPEQRKKLEEKFEEIANNTLHNFSQLHIKTTSDVTKVVKSGIIAKLAPIEAKATFTASNIADGWGLRPVHWSTYRATVVKMGEFQSFVRKEPYSWNDDLAGNYLKSLLPSWTGVFDTTLPNVGRQNYGTAKNLLLQFSTTVAESVGVICPKIKEPLQSLKESIDQLEPVLRETYITLWETKTSATRFASHQLLKPQILRFMTGTYKKASQKTGKGFKRLVEKILRDHLKDNGHTMYKESTEILTAALGRMITELKDDLDFAPGELVVQARDLFKMMLDNHTLNDPSMQKVLAAVKGKLLKDITTVIDNMMSSLEHNVRIPLEEEAEQVPSYEVNEQFAQGEDDESDHDDSNSDIDGDSIDLDVGLENDTPMELKP